MVSSGSNDVQTPVPGRAARPVLGGFLAAFVLAGVAGLAADLLTGDLLAVFLASQAALWTVMVATVVHVSRRYGSGSAARDLQLRVAWRDLPLGLLVSVLMRLAAGAVAVALTLLLEGEIDMVDQLEPFRGHRAALIAAMVLAVLVAPLVEELFFRGALLQSLVPILGAPGAIAAQAGLFALAHATADASVVQNVVLVGALWAAGVVLGVTVHVTGRLGPAIAGHAFFNLVTAVIVLAPG